MAYLLVGELEKIARQALVDEFNSRGIYTKIIGKECIVLTKENIVELEGSNIVNAWEHAYISALIYFKTSDEYFALSLGYMKEAITAFQWGDDSKKDLYNNIIGVNSTKTCNSLSEISSTIFELLYYCESGKVITPLPNPDLIVDIDNEPRIESNLIKTTLLKIITYEAYNSIMAPLKFLFNQAEAAYVRVDPLLVDLDGDGIETTTVQNGVFFDHESDGFAETSAWVNEDDGVLAIDKNNNGIIDNGNEIFGDNYIKADGTLASNGFEALAELDTNEDGIINAQDESYSQLKILKGDGNLLTLEQAGIESINIANTETNSTDINGNIQSHLGSYTKTDGTSGQLGDYWLQNDKMNSIAAEFIEVPADIEAMPNVRGMGTVYSLHQAMARDNVLKNLVTSYINASNPDTKMLITKQIIYQWAGVNDVAEDGRGADINGRNLAALEKFIGEDFVGVSNTTNPNAQAANLLNSAYESLVSYVYSELAAQTHLKPLYDSIEINFDETSGKVTFNMDNITALIRDRILTNESDGAALLRDFDRTFKVLGMAENANYQDYYDTFAAMGDNFKLIMDTSDKNSYYGTDSNDYFDGTANGEAYFTGVGNDTIYARQGNDIVYAGDGNDYIDVCEGDDIVYAGNGNDTIYGGNGNDIIDGGAGADKMYGGAGFDTYYVDNVNDQIIGEAEEYGHGNIPWPGENEGDEVYASVSYTLPDYVERLILTGTEAINGTGNSGNNYIKGNSANNILRGIDGYNTLDGGEGADTLIGGSKNDIYVIDNVNDVIIENGDNGKSNNDVVQSYINYSIANDDKLETLMLKGTENLNATGNDLDNNIYGNSGNNILIGGKGNDSLIAEGGQDTLYGGAGDDEYWIHESEGSIVVEYANEGIDRVIADFSYTLGDNVENLTLDGDSDLVGTGNDLDNTIVGNLGNDTLIGGKGNDVLNGEVYYYDGVPSYGMMMGDDDMGHDVMIGGVGDDIYFINDEQDTIIEYVNEGTDTVVSSINCTLGDNLENLQLMHFEKGLSGTGNNLDNIITGFFNNDTLIGGAGNDTLKGDYGDDTYIFNKNDGNDTINDKDGTDTVHFSESISKDNIAFFMDSSGNLIIDYGEQSGNDLIKIEHQSDTNYSIENFEVNDSTGNTLMLSNNDINRIIQDMNTYAAENGLSLSSVEDVKANPELMNLISNSWAA